MKRIYKFITASLLVCGMLNAQEIKEQDKQETTNNIGDVKVEQDTIYYDEEKTKIKIQTTFYKKDGKEIIHGPSKSYFPNGQIFTERNFKDGLADGIETQFNDKGEKELINEWLKGDLLRQKRYKNSVISSDTEVKTIVVKNTDPTKPDTKKIIKHGVQSIYYISGKIRLKINWKNDIQDGLETFYYENGKKKYELTWRNGVKEGIETQWFENEKISSITNWVENKAHGEMLNYHENGNKKDQLEFDKGVIINTRTSWNEAGSVIGQCTYKDGKPFKGTLFDIENLLLLTFEDGRQVSSKVCDRDGKLKQ